MYVTDSAGRLIDDIRIRKILLADPDDTVESVMDHRFEALSAFDDREEAVRQIARYDRFALPVVDSQGVLVGIVTADDVADVAEEEATEDIQKMAGVEALEEPYMRAPFLEMLKKRGGWLLLLFLGQLLTVAVLGHFEGSAGRGAGPLHPGDHRLGRQHRHPDGLAAHPRPRAAGAEPRATGRGSCGASSWPACRSGSPSASSASWACCSGTGWGSRSTPYPVPVAVSVGLAILGIVVWAVLLGAMLPLVLQRLGLDPATISSPMVATLMDVSGLVIYMAVAIVILRGTVL